MERLGRFRSSPGPRTCQGLPASYQHEEIDARTWAGWGFDLIKYDRCSYSQIAKDNSLAELQKPYLVMRDALKTLDRDIVYSLCQYGMAKVWWGPNIHDTRLTPNEQITHITLWSL